MKKMIEAAWGNKLCIFMQVNEQTPLNIIYSVLSFVYLLPLLF